MSKRPEGVMIDRLSNEDLTIIFTDAAAAAAAALVKASPRVDYASMQFVTVYDKHYGCKLLVRWLTLTASMCSYCSMTSVKMFKCYK